VKKVQQHKKYDQLIDAARDLFWKHGFRRVSVEEICRKAGISKMTYYRFFPNKLELAKKVYDITVDESVGKFRSIMADTSTPSEKMRNILQLKLESTNDISKEFLQDFYNNPEPVLLQYIEQKTRDTWNVVLSDFKDAQQKGWFRKDIKIEFLMYFSQKIVELTQDEYLLSMYEKPQDLIMEITNFFLNGLTVKDR
jgi:AcrR family transcriptional regulator